MSRVGGFDLSSGFVVALHGKGEEKGKEGDGGANCCLGRLARFVFVFVLVYAR